MRRRIGAAQEAMVCPPAVCRAGARASAGGLTPRCCCVRVSPPPSLQDKYAVQDRHMPGYPKPRQGRDEAWHSAQARARQAAREASCLVAQWYSRNRVVASYIRCTRVPCGPILHRQARGAIRSIARGDFATCDFCMALKRAEHSRQQRTESTFPRGEGLTAHLSHGTKKEL
jgi:hypothetical protein